MNTYIGIDLGTTNSVICSYDGTSVRVWKSDVQNDVTPSAIFYGPRGNKYIGQRAYDAAPHSRDHVAMLFKRHMGTKTPIELPAVGMTKSPEECSAEVLKALYGYLPEEVRKDGVIGTVITVPAAFNQMQKSATMRAAELAGLGTTALMQEPVASVMRVMRDRKSDGTFLIYDLGGGTLDIALAESIGGRVNLLAHGGIAMCGGRDFDRLLFDQLVKPWLHSNFSLPSNLASHATYRPIVALANWAVERAKIQLSTADTATVALSESETGLRDLSGKEIFIDFPVTRTAFDAIIDERVFDSVVATRDVLSEAGLSSHDIERIVFVGGPTKYKPLRDKVSFQLGIPGNSEVDPMTAVAEGAAMFAESIDWDSESRGRKKSQANLTVGNRSPVTFKYQARTSTAEALVVVGAQGQVPAAMELQIDSLDTGWTTGRVPVSDGQSIRLPVQGSGESSFQVFLFDSGGQPVDLQENKIVITRTSAAIDAIPASQSIGIQMLERLGGRSTLESLVRAGDPLPKKGRLSFKAIEALKAGSDQSINFKLWEGGIDDQVEDNRFIGLLRIVGSDFNDGVIPAGGVLLCDFEVRDSGNVVLDVEVPSVRIRKRGDFYSYTAGLTDFRSFAADVQSDADRVREHVDAFARKIDDPLLCDVEHKLDQASSLDKTEANAEATQEAMERLHEAKRLFAKIRRNHLKECRQLDLEGAVAFFTDHLAESATPGEQIQFDNLVKSAQRAIDRNDTDFEKLMSDIRGRTFEVLWRQDWFVLEMFKSQLDCPQDFFDEAQYAKLANDGRQALKGDDIDRLRMIVAQLQRLRKRPPSDDDIHHVVNIVRG